MEQVTTTGGNGAAAPQKELIKKTDYVEVGLIAVYLVQKLGRPTMPEIKAVAEDKLSVSMDGRKLTRALKGASKRGFIAVLQDRTEDSGGQVEKTYSMKDLSWKNPPEYAHINDLYPKMLQTDEGKAIKSYFDGTEQSSETKRTKGNVIDDYHALRFQCVLLTPILGSQIHCPATDYAREQGNVALPTVSAKPGKGSKVEVDPKKDDVPIVEGIFVVDELTGDYLIPPDVLQGWLATNAARYAGLPDARAGYVAFAPIRFKPVKPVMQLVLPVNNARSGPAAPKSYECISAGEKFEINMMVPTKGAMSVEQWEKLIILAGAHPRRGISPARGKRYGAFLVTGFEDLGPIKKGGIDFLTHMIPDSILEEHGEYLKEALARLKDVPLAGKFAGKATPDPEQNFPGSD